MSTHSFAEEFELARELNASSFSDAGLSSFSLNSSSHSLHTRNTSTTVTAAPVNGNTSHNTANMNTTTTANNNNPSALEQILKQGPLPTAPRRPEVHSLQNGNNTNNGERLSTFQLEINEDELAALDEGESIAWNTSPPHHQHQQHEHEHEQPQDAYHISPDTYLNPHGFPENNQLVNNDTGMDHPLLSQDPIHLNSIDMIKTPSPANYYGGNSHHSTSPQRHHHQHQHQHQQQRKEQHSPGNASFLTNTEHSYSLSSSEIPTPYDHSFATSPKRGKSSRQTSPLRKVAYEKSTGSSPLSPRHQLPPSPPTPPPRDQSPMRTRSRSPSPTTLKNMVPPPVPPTRSPSPKRFAMPSVVSPNHHHTQSSMNAPYTQLQDPLDISPLPQSQPASPQHPQPYIHIPQNSFGNGSATSPQHSLLSALSQQPPPHPLMMDERGHHGEHGAPNGPRGYDPTNAYLEMLHEARTEIANLRTLNSRLIAMNDESSKTIDKVIYEKEKTISEQRKQYDEMISKLQGQHAGEQTTLKARIQQLRQELDRVQVEIMQARAEAGQISAIKSTLAREKELDVLNIKKELLVEKERQLFELKSEMAKEKNVWHANFEKEKENWQRVLEQERASHKAALEQERQDWMVDREKLLKDKRDVDTILKHKETDIHELLNRIDSLERLHKNDSKDKKDHMDRIDELEETLRQYQHQLSLSSRTRDLRSPSPSGNVTDILLAREKIMSLLLMGGVTMDHGETVGGLAMKLEDLMRKKNAQIVDLENQVREKEQALEESHRVLVHERDSQERGVNELERTWTSKHQRDVEELTKAHEKELEVVRKTNDEIIKQLRKELEFERQEQRQHRRQQQPAHAHLSSSVGISQSFAQMALRDGGDDILPADSSIEEKLERLLRNFPVEMAHYRSQILEQYQQTVESSLQDKDSAIQDMLKRVDGEKQVLMQEYEIEMEKLRMHLSKSTDELNVLKTKESDRVTEIAAKLKEQAGNSYIAAVKKLKAEYAKLEKKLVEKYDMEKEMVRKDTYRECKAKFDQQLASERKEFSSLYVNKEGIKEREFRETLNEYEKTLTQLKEKISQMTVEHRREIFELEQRHANEQQQALEKMKQQYLTTLKTMRDDVAESKARSLKRMEEEMKKKKERLEADFELKLKQVKESYEARLNRLGIP